MENFKKGDFIRLKDLSKYHIERVYGSEVNIFEIKNIGPDYVEIKDCKTQLKISNIEPIPINGKDDFNIYYNPVIAADSLLPGESSKPRQTDYSYYLDAFKRCTYKDKTFYELVIKKKFKYVHEIQHFLLKQVDTSELYINAL